MQIDWSNSTSDELSLRIAPLRQLWEARGVGLLKRVAACIGREYLPAAATIVPLAPTPAGGGSIDRPSSTVYIQAMLVNPIPQLPEVARLAWMLAQLNEKRNVANGSAPSLALIPAVLDAAEEVELIRFDATTLKLALIHWSDIEPARVGAIGDTLLNWWHAHGVPNSWDARVADLDSKLGASFQLQGEACDSN